ncbi:MAG: fumarylacetoacetase, partial [Fimbriimonas ginsengisoli]|nr:fumarylacetoacetase [Fimbriimonas ginsengisoli]
MHFLAPADARSWIEVEPDSHFPIQNLPFGVIDRRGRRVATRLGDTVIDLVELADAGLLALAARDSVDAAALSLRPRLFELFLEDASALRDNAALRARALTPASTARMALPMPVRAF